MEVLKDKYSITELSARLNVTDHALRYYEREFCLKIPKDDRGRRYYTPEMANVMFQIKNMRDEGLEIKAIKKILYDDNIIKEPPPVVNEIDSSLSVTSSNKNMNPNMQLKEFFDDFKTQLTVSLNKDICEVKEQISKELYKTKLELGACVENSARKLEAKLDRHFLEVDKAIGNWRDRNKSSSPIRKLLNKL